MQPVIASSTPSNQLFDSIAVLERVAKRTAHGCGLDGSKVRNTVKYIQSNFESLCSQSSSSKKLITLDKKENVYPFYTFSDSAYIHFDEYFAAGTFKKVYLSLRVFKAKTVPCARLDVSFENKKEKNFSDREWQILEKLTNEKTDKIVELFAVLSSETSIQMFQELCPDEALIDRIEKRNLDINEKCVITKDITQILAYLQRSDLIHSDIKPDNFLLTKDLTGRLVVKLCDFSFYYHKDERWQNAGSVPYLPPELFSNEVTTVDSFKIDPWSAGCTFYLMCSEDAPRAFSKLCHRDKKSVFQDLNKELAKTSGKITKLLLKLLALNPAERCYGVDSVIEAQGLTESDFKENIPVDFLHLFQES